MDFDGTRALVTGASSGIGAALAEALAERGATVGLVARREDRLAEVLERCQEHTPDSRMWVQDLSDLDAVVPLTERADDELGGIDLFINNAGIPKRRRVVDLTVDEVDAVTTINYLSPIRIVLTLVPRMLERGRGRILSISSVAARLSPPGEAAYAATKSALTTFSECMAIELWDTPISVHVIDPGVVDTELFHLPGNDPLLAEVESEPPSAVVDAVLEQFENGRFEAYVPGWFEDLATGKAADLEGFLAGSAEWYREAREAAE